MRARICGRRYSAGKKLKKFAWGICVVRRLQRAGRVDEVMLCKTIEMSSFFFYFERIVASSFIICNFMIVLQ